MTSQHFSGGVLAAETWGQGALAKISCDLRDKTRDVKHRALEASGGYECSNGAAANMTSPRSPPKAVRWRRGAGTVGRPVRLVAAGQGVLDAVLWLIACVAHIARVARRRSARIPEGEPPFEATDRVAGFYRCRACGLEARHAFGRGCQVGVSPHATFGARLSKVAIDALIEPRPTARAATNANTLTKAASRRGCWWWRCWRWRRGRRKDWGWRWKRRWRGRGRRRLWWWFRGSRDRWRWQRGREWQVSCCYHKSKQQHMSHYLRPHFVCSFIDKCG